MSKYIGIGIVLGLFWAGGAWALGYTPPSPEKIATLVSSPAGITDMIKDATPAQAADVLIKGIEAIDSSSLTNDLKKQLIVRLVAYAVVQMDSRAPEMMAIVVRSVPAPWLQLVVATAMVATPDYMNAMRKAIVDALGAETDKGKLADLAAKDPHAVLGDFLYRLIRSILPRHALSAHQADLHDLRIPPPPPGYKQ